MKSLAICSSLVVALVSVAGEAAAGPASPTAREEPPVPCPDGEAPLFGAGATPATSGWFFPGTAVFDGEELRGEPYEIEKGCNIRFIVSDVAAVANGHQIVSFDQKKVKTKKGKKKRRGPLFRSEFVAGPGETLVKTEHLKPGTYAYFCAIHDGMFGLLKVSKPDRG